MYIITKHDMANDQIFILGVYDTESDTIYSELFSDIIQNIEENQPEDKTDSILIIDKLNLVVRRCGYWGKYPISKYQIHKKSFD